MPAAGILAVASVAGSVYGATKSAQAAKDARKSQEKWNDKQLAFEYEKWGEYLKDLQSRREAVDAQRRGQNEMARAKFESAMANWKLKDKAITSAIGEWKTIEKDPSAAPGWRGFRDAIMREATTQTKSFGKQLERAGRTGGAQDRIRMDMQDKLMTKLGTEMLALQEQARMKQLELESGRPAAPFLEYYGDPEVSAGVSQYGSSLQPWQPTPVETFNPDLSGFGMMANQLYRDWRSGQTTNVNISSGNKEFTGSFSGWEDYAQNTPAMPYLDPRHKILEGGY